MGVAVGYLFLFTAAVTPNAAVATNAITGPVGMLAWNERYMPITADITPISAPISMTPTNRFASRNPVAAGVMSIAMTKNDAGGLDANDDDEGEEGEQHVFHQACPDSRPPAAPTGSKVVYTRCRWKTYSPAITSAASPSER